MCACAGGRAITGGQEADRTIVFPVRFTLLSKKPVQEELPAKSHFKMFFFYALIILTALWSCQSSESDPSSDTPVSQTVHLDPHFLSKTAFPNSLNTPTHVLPIDGGASVDDRAQLYVVVDCWNNRVLCTSSLTLPLKDWKALITNIGTPHTAAVTRFEDERGGGSGSDTFWIVVEATVLNSLTCLKVCIRSGNVEVLDGHSVAVEGERPHKTIFIEDYKSFFSLSSEGPLLYLTRLKVESGGMDQPVSIPLPFLEVRRDRVNLSCLAKFNPVTFL